MRKVIRAVLDWGSIMRKIPLKLIPKIVNQNPDLLFPQNILEV